MKRLLAVLLCSVLILGGCSMLNSDTTEEYISKQIGIDFSEDNGYLVSMTNTHGGFLGDGEFIAIYTFEDNSVEEQVSENDKWSNTLSENVSSILYGSEYYTDKSIYEEFSRVYPAIENGYYFFYDRHSEAKDPYDDTDVFNRYSFNYTVAAYDCDNDMLYFIEVDT